MANLHRRHIILNDICEISKVQPDDQIHALWSCKEVEAVWGSFQWAHHAASPPPVNFADLLDKVMQVECFKNFLLSKTRPQHQWRPPDLHSFKANFDAAVFQATNTAGIGVIIRDSNGEVIGALSMPIPLSQSVAELEALACLRAVQFALEIGLRRVTFEGDSVTVINSIDRGFPEFLHMGILLMTFGFKLLLFNFHVFVMLNTIVKLWMLL
nr:hypothetical protein CFP56_49462 [Quercus suber]